MSIAQAARANLQMSRRGTDWAQRCVKTTTGQLGSDLTNWSTLQCKSMRQTTAQLSSDNAIGTMKWLCGCSDSHSSWRFRIAVSSDQECHNFKSQNFVIFDINIGIDESWNSETTNLLSLLTMTMGINQRGELERFWNHRYQFHLWPLSSIFTFCSTFDLFLATPSF